MNKLKLFMANHGFWLSTGMTVVVALAGFIVARITIDKQYAAQAAKLDTLYGEIESIKSSVTTHPNQFSHDQMQARANELIKGVEQGWIELFNRQAPTLKWPDKELGFDTMTKKLRPFHPSEKLKYPFDEANKEPLSQGERGQYARYFHDRFPILFKEIGCKWVGSKPVGMAAGGGMPGMDGGMAGMDGGMGAGGAMPGMDAGGMMGGMAGGGMPGSDMSGMGMGGYPYAASADIVIWPKQVQDTLISEIQLWKGEYPSAHEILYTQENIWILEELLKIIKKVNGDARQNHEAAIKMVQFLRIGKPATGRAGMITPLMGMGMGMGMGMDGMGGMGMDGMGGMDAGMGMGMEGGMAGMDAGMGGMGDGGMMMEGGMPGMDGMGMGMGPVDPANNRYVDSNYQPITGEDIRTKVLSTEASDAYFAVAKRVPVRMRFVMDQRKIQLLVTECGNSDILLEPRQVRIGNTSPAAVGAVGGFGMGMGMPGMDAGMGGMPGMDAGGMGGMPGMDGGMGAGGMPGMDGGMGMAGGMMGGGMPGMDPTGMANKVMGTVPGGRTMDVPVEIFAIVTLVNPPDIKRLNLDKIDENTALTDTVEKPEDAKAEGKDAAKEGDDAKKAPPAP